MGYSLRNLERTLRLNFKKVTHRCRIIIMNKREGNNIRKTYVPMPLEKEVYKVSFFYRVINNTQKWFQMESVNFMQYTFISF